MFFSVRMIQLFICLIKLNDEIDRDRLLNFRKHFLQDLQREGLLQKRNKAAFMTEQEAFYKIKVKKKMKKSAR